MLNPPVRGALYLMSFVNVQIVQRSWGLFELASRSPTTMFPPELSTAIHNISELSYGPAFKYEEFMVLPSRLHALLLYVFVNIVLFALAIFPPVSIISSSAVSRR